MLRTVCCPETGDDCASGDCSIKICMFRQARILAEQRRAEWEARNREAAAWRAIRDLVAQHNPLITANKPGVATDKDGNIINTRLRLPRSKKRRQDLIARALASTKPDIVARIRIALSAILAEERRRNGGTP